MKNHFILIACVLSFSGCASTSILSPYSSRLTPVIKNIKENKQIDLSKKFLNESRSADKVLYLMERGRIAQIQGDVERSKINFQSAIDAIKQNDQKAIISASGAVAQGGALLVNDNAIPYQGDGYERVMLYHFQAMNYLADHDIEGAGVEVRRANFEQEEALKRHEKEILEAQQSAQKHGVSNQMPFNVVQAFINMDESAAPVKNSFQNAYTFYLSGIVYEMLGQANDAYIDYKKALEIFPNNSYLQRDVIRLAQELNMNDDLGQLKANYPNAAAGRLTAKSGGELIVLFEDDFVPPKQQIKLPIPLSFKSVKMSAFAFPYYKDKPLEISPLVLTEANSTVATTETICYMRSLAVKSLKEKIPAIVIRQLIRSSIKALEAYEAGKEFGSLGSLAMSAVNFISENVDVRSWSTLPYDVQLLRVVLPEGEHNFIMTHQGSGASGSIEVNIGKNTKKIIRAVRAGNKLYLSNLI